ncbi:J domain-containing protein [Pseudomonas aeruginosa]
MTEVFGYYKVLKVTQDAPQSVVRGAYKALASEYHPDRNQGNISAQNMMVKINEAYEVLSNADKRMVYDLSQRQLQERLKSDNFRRAMARSGDAPVKRGASDRGLMLAMRKLLSMVGRVTQ